MYLDYHGVWTLALFFPVWVPYILSLMSFLIPAANLFGSN